MQRKVFRIEQMIVERNPRSAAKPFARRNDDARPPRSAGAAQPASADQRALQDARREFDTVNLAIERNKLELAALNAGPGEEARTVRARQELGAAVDNMEKATQQILKAAEAIDEGARALHATLKNDYNRGLSQDIFEHVVRIYEACNFQDLSGQHIGKAIDTLTFVEDRIARMVGIWGDVKTPNMPPAPDTRPVGRALVNGPKVEGDSGHVDQNDVDNLFGCA